jgi:glycosyltransferase involved in cell wall biosynthesis
VSVTIACIVPSFNRPRLLREALTSASGADQIIVVDDGSDFDALALCREFAGVDFIGSPPLTPIERMTTLRQGRQMNRALEAVRCDVVAYLCDDDLLHPGWFDALRGHYSAPDAAPLVRGGWLVFEDGDTPSEHNPPCPMDPSRGMTAGNFAHLASLTRECGARWPEDRLNCLDDLFLHSLHHAGADTYRTPHLGVIAGWRREHPLANGHYSDGKNHTPEFLAVLERGYLEMAR